MSIPFQMYILLWRLVVVTNLRRTSVLGDGSNWGGKSRRWERWKWGTIWCRGKTSRPTSVHCADDEQTLCHIVFLTPPTLCCINILKVLKTFELIWWSHIGITAESAASALILMSSTMHNQKDIITFITSNNIFRMMPHEISSSGPDGPPLHRNYSGRCSQITKVSRQNKLIWSLNYPETGVHISWRKQTVTSSSRSWPLLCIPDN